MDRIEAAEILDTFVEDNNYSDYHKALRMAIDALKEQLSCEGTTSDLISKTETVERLRGALETTYPSSDHDGGFIDGIEYGINIVSTMPTIQPAETDICVGDTISRQWLLECINDGWIKFDTDKDANKFIHLVRDIAPTIQPEPQWIPVSERMPEEHEWIGTKQFGTTISDEVYVTFENEKGERFCKHLSFQNGKLSAFDKSTIDAFYKGSKPIAWMSLPEPYKPNK